MLNLNFKQKGAALFIAASFLGGGLSATAHAEEPKVKDIVTTYADIALATYEDSLATAVKLKSDIDKFLAKPDAAGLAEARKAWIIARAPYQQSEAFRFGNSIVDEWEGKVNSWPLDEGLIDYVSNDYGSESDENDLYVANVIAKKSIQIGGQSVDASKIDKTLIGETLHEAGDVEANVARGYHAIEFLLWGQDLNGTGAGAGNRPFTDYDLANCSNGNCDRRAAYLQAATDLLVDDLTWMVAQWGASGEARVKLLGLTDSDALTTIFTGLGSLSYGELAGERMKLGLILHDPEEEHDCFSDNTHNSHYNDQLGMQNVYLGRYKRVDGSVVTGASVSQLLKARNAAAEQELTAKIAATVTAMEEMVKRAETVEAYDQMIAEGNKQGNDTIQAVITGLTNQTKSIERAVAVLNLKSIEFEGSDSLDAPEKVSE